MLTYLENAFYFIFEEHKWIGITILSLLAAFV